MTARLAIDRAYVQTSATANAAQDFAAVRSQDFRALVIHENDVHFFGTRGAVFAGRSIDELGVNSELLACGGAA